MAVGGRDHHSFFKDGSSQMQARPPQRCRLLGQGHLSGDIDRVQGSGLSEALIIKLKLVLNVCRLPDHIPESSANLTLKPKVSSSKKQNGTTGNNKTCHISSAGKENNSIAIVVVRDEVHSKSAAKS
jgi:hypothetical protein